jgi:hypothetical protein
MLELMALADGELEGEERARAERLAAESAEARRVVEAMRSPALGAFLDGAFAPKTAAAGGIADAVMARIASDGGGALAETGGVVRLADVRVRRGPRVQLLVASGLAALAVAAAIALWFQSRDVLSLSGSPVASVGAPMPLPSVEPIKLPTAQSAAALAQEGKGLPGVEVDEIDSPSHDVHVFEIPVSEPSSTAAAAAHVPRASSVVIMIDEEPGTGP